VNTHNTPHRAERSGKNQTTKTVSFAVFTSENANADFLGEWQKPKFDFDIKSILFAVDLKWFDWMAQNDLIGWLSEALFKNSSPTIKLKLHKARTHSS
jgi:hypothetical protein